LIFIKKKDEELFFHTLFEVLIKRKYLFFGQPYPNH